MYAFYPLAVIGHCNSDAAFVHAFSASLRMSWLTAAPFAFVCVPMRLLQ